MHAHNGGHMKERIKHLILFLILVGIDQGSKLWVKTSLAGKNPLVIIPDVLNLQYHSNNGAVWGILSGKVPYLIIFTLIVLLFIIYLYFKIPDGKKHGVLKVLTVFILAGAVGNLIDRIYLGYVVDFIYFEIINFPLFNFADSCLTVSSILLFLLAVFYFKDEDFAFLDQVFGKRKKKSFTEENEDGEAVNAGDDESDEDDGNDLEGTDTADSDSTDD
jgi:signal peptidase II